MILVFHFRLKRSKQLRLIKTAANLPATVHRKRKDLESDKLLLGLHELLVQSVDRLHVGSAGASGGRRLDDVQLLTDVGQRGSQLFLHLREHGEPPILLVASGLAGE